MTKTEREAVYLEILSDKRYGVKEMRKKWVEELLELALCLQHSQNKGVTDYDHLTKEMADVYIGLEQMLFLYGNSKDVEEIVTDIVSNLPDKLELPQR